MSRRCRSRCSISSCLVVMLISGLLAMIRGFMREILSIGAWVIAALVDALRLFARCCRSRKAISASDMVATGVIGRRHLPAHAADRLGHHRAHLRHDPRQPGRRARPHARLPVRARPRADHRGGRLPVFRLAGARPQPAGMGARRQVESRAAKYGTMADVHVAGRPRKDHLAEVQAAEAGRPGRTADTDPDPAFGAHADAAGAN